MAITNGLKDTNLWSPTDGMKASTIGTVSTNGAQYSTIQYPNELGTDRYPYSMMIYVNANSASELVTDGQQSVQPIGANAVSTAKANGVNQSVTSAIRSKAPANQTFITSYKRLNFVIGLPMPKNITFDSDANYREVSAGFLGTVIHDLANEEFATAGKDTLRALMQGVISGSAGVVSDSKTGSDDVAALALKLQGVAKNDRKEQAFEGVGVREFHFSWMFVPKSKGESDAITNIVKWLKYNQHPEVQAGNGLQVILPNEFDIEFRHKNKEITGMPKITTCVLHSVKVNYTPLDKFVAFAGTDNPVAIALDLTFKELEPLVRSMIVRGY